MVSRFLAVLASLLLISLAFAEESVVDFVQLLEELEEAEEVFNASEVSGTCGGNCPGGRCPSCPCGTKRSSASISKACAAYGWSKNCCDCIIRHESGGNANSMNYNSNGSFDVGLFQINQVNWKGCNGGKPPCSLSSNVKCAVAVYKGRNSWRPWSTCRTCGCC